MPFSPGECEQSTSAASHPGSDSPSKAAPAMVPHAARDGGKFPIPPSQQPEHHHINISGVCSRSGASTSRLRHRYLDKKPSEEGTELLFAFF